MNDATSTKNSIQDFAHCGTALYQFADELDPECFPSAFFRLVRNAIRFDGASMGRASVDRSENAVKIEDAHVYGRRPDLLDEWERQLRHDPLTARFLLGLESPLACTLPVFYRKRGAQVMEDFAVRHELSQILLFGESVNGALQWLAFYRKTEVPFGDEDTAFLHALWPMFRSASRMNLLRALERADEGRHSRAFALINRSGGVEAADTRFLQLLREEAPQHDVASLPPRVMQVLMQGRPYRGMATEIEMKAMRGHAVCTIRRRPGVSRLSQAEARVAEHLLTGLSYKQIALRTGTSPNTVRNQIAQLYRKLGVHDKFGLLAALRSHSPNSYLQ